MERLKNFGRSTLAAALSNSATSLTVTDATKFPGAGNFRLKIDDELVLVTAVSGTTFTVTRAAESTTAAAHSSGTRVEAVLTAASLTQVVAEAIAAALVDYATSAELTTLEGAVDDVAADVAQLDADLDQLTSDTSAALAGKQPLHALLTALAAGTIDGVTIGATTPVQAQARRPTNAQTGTTYTLVAADAGKLVTLANADPITLTIPTNASVAFPVGTEVDLAQLGAGAVSVAPAGGVTIHSLEGLTDLAGQYAGATLKKLATNEWLLVGGLA